MEVFRELGLKVNAIWEQRNYHIECFPTIAREALVEANLTGIDTTDICDWVINSHDFVNQVNIDSAFGEPPLTVFANNKFYIELLFWLSGTTSIHHHSFSGAFYVLSGSSIHSEYDFVEQYRVSEDLLLGELRINKIELLSKGQCREIRSGASFIHSLYHLDYPSISIVIRTFKDNNHPVQYGYIKPSAAIRSFSLDQRARRQLQILQMLKKSSNPVFPKMLQDFIRNRDLHAFLYVTISLLHENLLSTDEMQNLLKSCEADYGKLISFIRPIFDEAERVSNLQQARKYITKRDHRFFMALLMNASDRDHVNEIVKFKFVTEDPTDKIFGWIKELNAERKFKVIFDEFQLDLLEIMLRDSKRDDVLTSLKKKYSAAQIDQNLDTIQEMFSELKKMPVFKILFDA